MTKPSFGPCRTHFFFHTTGKNSFPKSLSGSVFNNIHELFFADVPRGNLCYRSLARAMTLTPEGSAFRIAGDGNLLGECSNGAGGPDRTTRVYRFILPLAA